jgi:hypothetical protein
VVGFHAGRPANALADMPELYDALRATANNRIVLLLGGKANALLATYAVGSATHAVGSSTEEPSRPLTRTYVVNASNAHGAGTTTRLDSVIRLLGDIHYSAGNVKADQAFNFWALVMYRRTFTCTPRSPKSLL